MPRFISRKIVKGAFYSGSNAADVINWTCCIRDDGNTPVFTLNGKLYLSCLPDCNDGRIEIPPRHWLVYDEEDREFPFEIYDEETFNRLYITSPWYYDDEAEEHNNVEFVLRKEVP